MPSLPCMIIAGGASQRFGASKALASLNGQSLLSRVTACLSKQTTGPIALNTNTPEDYPSREIADLTLLQDTHFVGEGPLCGLLTALDWAKQIDARHVITCPVDTPFLPDDFISKLMDVGKPAIAQSDDRWHPVCGIWPSKSRSDLYHAMEQGLRSAHGWARQCEAVRVPFDSKAGPDPFFNINTQADLRLAERLLEDDEPNAEQR